jgi:pimeloyl-ACP methyl ester carboxylesterase
MTPVVYLHGFASSPASSKARHFRDRLAQAGVPVTVPDLADGDFEHLTITAQLKVVAAAAGAGPVSLVGSSMGGWLAALYASTHPEIDRLVLLAPAFGFNRRWPERVGPVQMDRWRRDNQLAVFHYGDNRIRSVGYQLVEDAARYPDFPDFPQPALIFHGAHDDVVPAAYAEEFARGRANVRLDVVDSGHDLLNVLEKITERAVDFLTAPVSR